MAADAAGALAALDPRMYPVLPPSREWRGVGVAALALVAVVLVPLPAIGDGGRRAAEANAIAAARRTAQELAAAQPKTAAPSPLAQATVAELKSLDQQLARARNAAEAARALEQAQEHVAGLAQPEDYAWQRAVDGLAGAWAGQPDLAPVAQALRNEDPQAVERAMADVAARADRMSDKQRQQLQLALQSGANAARDVPGLAAALRQAAAQTAARDRGSQGSQGSQSGEGGQSAQSAEGGQSEASKAIEAVGRQLAQGASRAAGVQGAQGTLSGLNDARAALGALDATGPLAAGTVTGTAVAGRIVPGSPTGTPTAAAVVAVNAAGAGPGTSGSANGNSGSGANGSSASGNSSGANQGQGASQGSGAGLGSAPGQPSSGQQAGAGATTPRDLAAPNTRPAGTYDPVYAPSLMGGEGGQTVQAPSDPSGATGDTVSLPNSPVVVGAQRPYDEVYGQYEANARQSVARQSLPPSLQGLVQRYFSSIDPRQK